RAKSGNFNLEDEERTGAPKKFEELEQVLAENPTQEELAGLLSAAINEFARRIGEKTGLLQAKYFSIIKNCASQRNTKKFTTKNTVAGTSSSTNPYRTSFYSSTRTSSFPTPSDFSFRSFVSPRVKTCLCPRVA
ncbi:hypothetical protein WH47_07291, partial [Habropoda laboriosa]